MAIRVAYPTDKRRPGSGVEFDFVTGAQGLAPVARKVLMIGIAKGGTQLQHTPIQVFTDKDAEDYFGIGTELTLMLRKGLEVGRFLGTSPEFWGIGIDELGAGVAAAGSFVITGSPTVAGDIVFRIAGRTMRAACAVGDNATAMGTSVANAIAKNGRNLPVTSANAAGTVTHTCRTKGTWGNDIALEVVSKPAGVSITVNAMAAGAGLVSIVSALDAAATRDYPAVGIGNHATQDITDWLAHSATMWAAMVKKFRYACVGERGSLGTAQTLTAAANHETVLVASCPSTPSLSSELAAALATLLMVHEQPNRNRNNTVVPIYPPPLASELIDSQVESALGSGATPLTIDTTGQYAKFERVVTTRTTVSAAPFEGTLDFGNSWALAKFAKEIDPILARLIADRNINDSLIGDIRREISKRARARANDDWFTDVETLLAQLKVERDPNVNTRVLYELPSKPTPIANQVIGKHVLIS
jgi:phage tail sheath gpL-like